MSQAAATELIGVLAYPRFGLTEDEKQDLLAGCLPWCESVTDVPVKVQPELRDRSNQPFPDLAIAGRAKFLVTGDAHLLDLKAALPIADITGRGLLTVLGSDPAVQDNPRLIPRRPRGGTPVTAALVRAVEGSRD